MIIKTHLQYLLISDLQKNVGDAKILSRFYLSHHGALQRIVKYIYQYVVFRGFGDVDSANIALSMAFCKMEHVKFLENLIFNLGGREVVCELPLDFICYKDLEKKGANIKILIDDIVMEMTSIKEYQKIKSVVKEQKVKECVNRIILDEEDHLNLLKERLCNLTGKRYGC